MKERLEDVLPAGEATEGLVLLLRGGVHDEGVARLQEQAAELNRRYSFDDGDCYGISVFAATEESEARVLARNMRVRRRYYRLRYEDVADLRIVPRFFELRIGRSCSTAQTVRATSGSWTPRGDLRDNPHWRQVPGRSLR